MMTNTAEPIHRVRDRKLVIVKVGTDSIWQRGGFNLPHMQHILSEIEKVRQSGYQVVLVSSGAVAAGREYYRQKNGSVPPKETESPPLKQKYAIKGNPLLMDAYRACDQRCAQVLTHRPDLRLGHVIDCLRLTLDEDELPIVNGNDASSVAELKYTDNDNLSTRLAAMMGATRHIILTTTQGILDDHGSTISTVEPHDRSWLKYIRQERSANGRGGMRRKGRLSAWLAEKQKIPTTIAHSSESGEDQSVIARILLQNETIGTTFLPAQS